MKFLGQLHEAEQSFGTKLGSDIGDILQGLAHKKLQHQDYNHKRQFLSSVGLDHNTASSLAHRDDKFIGDFLKQLGGFDYGDQNQQNTNGSQQGLEGLIGQTDQNEAQDAQYNNQQQSPDISRMVEQAYADNPGLEQRVSPEQLGNMFMQDMQQQGQQQGNGYNNPLQPAQQQRTGLRPRGQSKSAAPVSDAEKQQLKSAQEKSQQYIDTGEQSKKHLEILKEYKNILKSEDIGSPGWFNFSKLTGNTFSRPTQAAQVLSKLSEQLVPPARTDAELRSFQARVPNPSQDKETQLRLVDSQIKDAERNIKRARITEDILNKSNGIASIGIDRLINKRLGQDESDVQGLKMQGKVTSLSDLTDVKNGTIAIDDKNGSRKEFYNGKWRSVAPWRK